MNLSAAATFGGGWNGPFGALLLQTGKKNNKNPKATVTIRGCTPQVARSRPSFVPSTPRLDGQSLRSFSRPASSRPASGGLLRRPRVCYNGGGARRRLPGASIEPSFRSRASGSRARRPFPCVFIPPHPSQLRRSYSVVLTRQKMKCESSNRRPFQSASCVLDALDGEGLRRLPKPRAAPLNPRKWSVVTRSADGERRLLRVRRRGALQACGDGTSGDGELRVSFPRNLPLISFVASCAAGERACRRARRFKKPIRAGERRNTK